MLIGEVSRLLDIPIETLRYYDRIGLVSPGRKTGVRQYSEQELQRLKAVLKMKSLMFSLEEIQTILSVDAQIDKSLRENSPDLKTVQVLHRQISAKLQEVEDMSQNIRDVKLGLSHLLKKVEAVLKGGNPC